MLGAASPGLAVLSPRLPPPQEAAWPPPRPALYLNLSLGPSPLTHLMSQFPQKPHCHLI